MHHHNRKRLHQMPQIKTTAKKLLEFLQKIEVNQQEIVNEATDIIYGNAIALKDMNPKEPAKSKEMLNARRQPDGTIKGGGWIRSVEDDFPDRYRYPYDEYYESELFSGITNSGNTITLPDDISISRGMYLLDNYNKKKKTWFSIYPPKSLDPGYVNHELGTHEVNFVKCYLMGYRILPFDPSKITVAVHVRGRDILINAFLLSIDDVYNKTKEILKDKLEDESA